MPAGRKPKPTRLKLVQGNPGKRPINKAEAKPPKAKVIRAPAHLPAEGRKEYRRVARMLTPIGLLTEVDLKALELYAETYAVWREAVEKVHIAGLVVKAKNGYPGQNPYLAIATNASKRMQSLLAEFGMTPSSRSRIGVSTPEVNEFDDV